MGARPKPDELRRRASLFGAFIAEKRRGTTWASLARAIAGGGSELSAISYLKRLAAGQILQPNVTRLRQLAEVLGLAGADLEMFWYLAGGKPMSLELEAAITKARSRIPDSYLTRALNQVLNGLRDDQAGEEPPGPADSVSGDAEEMDMIIGRSPNERTEIARLSKKAISTEHA